MKHRSYAVVPLISVALGFGLSACDSRQSPHEQLMSSDAVSDQSPSAAPAKARAVAEGHKLTEVAGQATLPKSTSGVAVTEQLSADELNFVGRYHTQIACEDTFVRCDHGQAEYILNLLPDGTAHRMIVHYGKLHTENAGQLMNQSYRMARWRVNQAQKELVISAEDGRDFYYQIDAGQRLIMQVDKNQPAQAIDRSDPAGQPYFVPSQAYVLNKDVEAAASEAGKKS